MRLKCVSHAVHIVNNQQLTSDNIPDPEKAHFCNGQNVVVDMYQAIRFIHGIYLFHSENQLFVRLANI